MREGAAAFSSGSPVVLRGTSGNPLQSDAVRRSRPYGDSRDRDDAAHRSGRPQPRVPLRGGDAPGTARDLLRDALAYRPLSPLAADGPVLRRLPGRLRRYGVWAPHALVGAGALLVFAIGYSTTDFFLAGLLPAVAVLMTLVRPVAAFWTSLSAATAYAFVAGGGGPWLPVTFLTQILVMTVVAARSRPRAGAWMWVVTGVYGVCVEACSAVGTAVPARRSCCSSPRWPCSSSPCGTCGARRGRR